MKDCTARMINQPKAAHSSKAATVITAPLIIAVFCLDDHKRLSSFERGLAGLLRLAIASVQQQLGCSGVTLLCLRMKCQQYLLGSSKPVLVLLAKHVGQQDMQVWKLWRTAVRIAALALLELTVLWWYSLWHIP